MYEPQHVRSANAVPAIAGDIFPVAANLKVTQIIVTALTCGCVFFLAVALMVQSQQEQPDEQTLLTMTLLISAGLMIAARMIVPNLVAAAGVNAALRNAAKEPGEDAVQLYARLVGIYQTRLIVACALIDAALFQAAIAYLIEGSPIALAVAAFLLLLLIFHMPTKTRVDSWIRNQLRGAEAHR